MNFKKELIKVVKGYTIEGALLNIDLLLEVYNKKLISFYTNKDRLVINLNDGVIIGYKEGNTIDCITYIKGGY